MSGTHPDDTDQFEPRTWRIRVGRLKEEPNVNVWAVSHELSSGSLDLYYYRDRFTSVRVKKHQLDLASVPAHLLWKKSVFSTQMIHDAWLRRFTHRLEYKILKCISHDDFMSRLAQGEDISTLRKELPLKTPNRKKHGRQVPDDLDKDADDERSGKRLGLNNELPAQEIFHQAFIRELSENEISILQTEFRYMTTPKIDVPIRYFHTALIHQRINRQPFWEETSLAEYLDLQGVAVVIPQDNETMGGTGNLPEKESVRDNKSDISSHASVSEEQLAKNVDESISTMFGLLEEFYRNYKPS